MAFSSGFSEYKSSLTFFLESIDKSEFVHYEKPLNYFFAFDGTYLNVWDMNFLTKLSTHSVIFRAPKTPTSIRIQLMEHIKSTKYDY